MNVKALMTAVEQWKQSSISLHRITHPELYKLAEKLAGPVSGGCGGWDRQVSVAELRAMLKSLDKQPDLPVKTPSDRKLSPLATRLLAAEKIPGRVIIMSQARYTEVKSAFDAWRANNPNAKIISSDRCNHVLAEFIGETRTHVNTGCGGWRWEEHVDDLERSLSMHATLFGFD